MLGDIIRLYTYEKFKSAASSTLLIRSGACGRLQPAKGTPTPQGFGGRLKIPLKF